MKEKIKPVYYCEHCQKHGLSKHMMAHHEAICFKNPENKRPCFECAHLIKKQTSVTVEYNHGAEYEKQLNLLYCNKKKLYLYTPKNEVKKNFYDLEDDVNAPMPRNCDEYKKPEYVVTGDYIGGCDPYNNDSDCFKIYDGEKPQYVQELADRGFVIKKRGL